MPFRPRLWQVFANAEIGVGLVDEQALAMRFRV
jgi:hypothetical protein